MTGYKEYKPNFKIEKFNGEASGQEVSTRSRYDAPDVYGLLIVEESASVPSNVRSGDKLKVKVTGSSEHDLYAEIIKAH